MSYEVEPGGYLLDEENFGEHSIELINGEKNGSVWLIVDKCGHYNSWSKEA